MVIPCLSKQESFNQRNVFKQVDAKLLDCEQRFGGEGCEVLLIPNIMVASLYHYPLSDGRNISLPIGYISFAPELIESVTQNILLWSAAETKFNHYFERKDTDPKDTVLNKHFSPILLQTNTVEEQQIPD